MTTPPRRRSRKRDPAANTSSAPPLGRGSTWVLGCLVVGGLVLSIYLTYVHYRLHADPGWRSVSCDSVILSSYGSIRGMPISLFGVWFYFLVAIVVVLSRWGRRLGFPRSAAIVVLVGGVAATVASVVLAIVSISALGTFCPPCVALYAINVAIAVIAWRAVRRSGEGMLGALKLERAHWRANRALSVALSLFALLLLGASLALYSHSAGASTICDQVAKAAASDRSVDVVVYCDFQSPHCRSVAADLAGVMRDQKGGLRVASRFFPLDPTCNRHVTSSRHAGSCRLALAAICADAQGRGPEFSAAAFDSGGSNYIEGIAAALRLDTATFEACLTSDSANRLLQASIEEAAARDVHATPTLFIDGIRHVGRLERDDLRCLATAASWQPLEGTK